MSFAQLLLVCEAWGDEEHVAWDYWPIDTTQPQKLIPLASLSNASLLRKSIERQSLQAPSLKMVSGNVDSDLPSYVTVSW